MVDQPLGSHGKTNKSALSPTCAIIPCDDSCDVRETKRQPWRETVLASLEQRHTAHRRCELLQTPSCAIKICVCTLKNCFASSLSDMTMVWMKNTSLSIELQIWSKPTVANDCDVPCEPNTNGFSVGLACIVDQRDTRNLNQMHHFMGADRIQKNVAVIEPVYHHLQLAWHATQEIAWWDPRGLCFRLAKFQGTCVYASTHFTNAVIHSQVKTASFSGVREAGCHYELQCALFPTYAAAVLPFFTEDSLDYVRNHKRFNFDRIKSTRVLSQTLAACNSTLMWQKIRIEWNPKHKVPDSKETNRKRNHDSQSVQPSPHFLKMSSIHAFTPPLMNSACCSWYSCFHNLVIPTTS